MDRGRDTPKHEAWQKLGEAVCGFIEFLQKNNPIRLYVSGPMTGLPDLNFPAFIDATEKLRLMGYEVISPVEINGDPEAKWEDCLKKDIEELMKCDSIVLLDGWHLSGGAQLEMHVAHRVGMGILFYKDLVKELAE